MSSSETWERRWHLARQRTDAKIVELRQIGANVQKSPPDLTVAKNLKKRHYPAVEKITAELKDVLNEQHHDSDSLKAVERKYLEILKVWSITEKTLTQIIYAREAETSIQEFYFDQVDKLRKSFDQTATDIGANQKKAEELQTRNKSSYAFATNLWQSMCKSVDRARELPILEPMCNKLDSEWEQLISGMRERDKILSYSALFWKSRDNFEWQCRSWCRHLNDFLHASRNNESIAVATIQEAEDYGKYAEEYSTLCYSMHKQVAQNGKKLLGLLQDTSEHDRRIKLDMSSAVEKICVALDELLTLRDTVRDTADTSRKLAAFYLDAEKVTKWIEELGRPYLQKSHSVGRSIERSTQLLDKHVEFERVCQNTYSNVGKLLENGKSLAKQFPPYHEQIGDKCRQLSDMTTAFEREVSARRDILESAVSFYTKVRDMWRIFEEIREIAQSRSVASSAQLGSFEKSHEEVAAAMQLTVATGSDLIAKLRIRNTDRHAEQHILDLVQSIRQNSSSVNTKLVSEQQRLEALRVKSAWQRDVAAEIEKLAEWRLDKGQREATVGEFGPQITQLTNFVIKEQGKCFELARTGRELIMLVRDESTDDVERLLNQLMREQKHFEETAEEIKAKLEHSYQTQESLKNATTTLSLIHRAEKFFHASPCNVKELKSAETTKGEFTHMKRLLDRTEKVMDDFELYQKGESLEDPEVINRRQDVHSAWSRLQLLVEEREALIRKAIAYHKTMHDVNEVLDGLETEWFRPDSGQLVKAMESEELAVEIEKHASKRKLILQATGLAHKHGHTFRKSLDPTSQVQQLVARQLLQLGERDKRVKHGWTCHRKLLEEKQTFILFEKICKTAIEQIQDLLKEQNKEKVRSELSSIKEKLGKIYDAAENYRHKNVSNADQMKLWVDKIKHRHVALYKHAGEDLAELGSSMPKVFSNSNGLIERTGESEKDKRRSNLLAELIRKEHDYIEILKLTLNVYAPAARSASAPAALRESAKRDEVFGNMADLLRFHEKFNAQLTSSCEIEELANCFVINSSEISDLYVVYCKGMEKSQQIIKEKSDDFFRRVQESDPSVTQPILSCLIWPVQKMMKYVQLLKEILDCISDPANELARQKLKEAIAVMEAVPGKANDAMHLDALQDAPRSELVRQGAVVIHERKVLPGKLTQKARERHLFLFETALILCKRTENKEYVARNTIPISKLQFESSNDYFTVWGNGNRVSLKPLSESVPAKSSLDEVSDWASKIKMVLSWSATHTNGNHTISNSSLVSSSHVPPPMAIFRSLPRPTKKFSSESELKPSSKASLEV